MLLDIDVKTVDERVIVLGALPFNFDLVKVSLNKVDQSDSVGPINEGLEGLGLELSVVVLQLNRFVLLDQLVLYVVFQLPVAYVAVGLL